MLAHNIKDILTIVPEAREFVKQANLEEDFPLDCKDSASASYLRAHYLIKIAGRSVPEDVFALIKKAATLYGVKEELDEMVVAFNTIEKSASEYSQQEQYGLSLKDLEANFEGDLAGFGFLGIEKAASIAQGMVDKYGSEVQSEQVKRYAGQAWLDKQAAVMTLANRFHATKGKVPEYVKIARVVVDNVREDDHAAIRDLCASVTTLDKQAGLDIIGFNFYKEALITKQAAFEGALTVNLAGEAVPYTKVMAFGKDRIGSSMGEDIAAEMGDDPVTNKAVLEALPRDLQIMLKSLLKNV